MIRSVVVALALAAEFVLGFFAGRQHPAPVKLIPPVSYVKDSPRATPSAASRSIIRAWLPSAAVELPVAQDVIPAATPSAVPPSRSAAATPSTSPSPRGKALTVDATAGIGGSVAAQGPDVHAARGSTSGPTVKQIAESQVPPAQWACLDALWQHESGWNPRADNPTSTAYGIAQMLTETSSDPAVQIAHGLAYIAARYGTPCRAWRAWQQKGWY